MTVSSNNATHGLHKNNFDITEAYFLFFTSATGVFFNLTVIFSILFQKNLRKMISAFIVHGCILDFIKCGYCIPFGMSLIHKEAPQFCSVLGGSYVMIVTASTFNLIAMICCEVYTFSEHNVGAAGEGSLCCVLFGVVMVYIGSIIIHLGPTIIAGNFNYNEKIGNCLFTYGTIKSYVIHTIWIAIMTTTVLFSFYYLKIFYKHVQENSTHRVASLVRMSLAISRGKVPNSHNVDQQILDSMSRVRCLIAITVIFVLCWYPLFVLTLADPKFEQPTRVYRILSLLAWCNPTVTPLVFLCGDRSISIIWRCFKGHCNVDDEPDTSLMMSGLNASAPMLQHNQNVGSRLSRDSSLRSSQNNKSGIIKIEQYENTNASTTTSTN